MKGQISEYVTQRKREREQKGDRGREKQMQPTDSINRKDIIGNLMSTLYTFLCQYFTVF